MESQNTSEKPENENVNSLEVSPVKIKISKSLNNKPFIIGNTKDR
jgi:hypothetical protein